MEKEVFPTMLYNPPYYNFGVAPSLCLKVIEKEMLKKFIQDVPEGISMGEDLSVSFPALFSAQTVYFMEQSGYYYRMNPTSITHKYNSEASVRVKALLDYMDKQLSQYDIYNINDQMDMYAAWITAGTVGSLVLGSNNIEKDLKGMRELFGNPHVINGMKLDIPMKSKILLRLAAKGNTQALKVIKKCVEVKHMIRS